ncbi:MAG: HAD hydrolase-like protein [Acetatifactor sp.]
MKKYLLFDLDGTLTDPKVGICTCVQYALKAMGIDEPDLDKLEPFIGPPLKDSFMEFYHMSSDRAEEAIVKYRERFADKGIFENKVYEGIPEMLKALQAQGMLLAVASSKPEVYVERILEHFGIRKYFKAVVGSELDGTRVNKDEVIDEALRRLFDGKRVEKELVYMIGDRRFDMEGARAHGIESVGVTYGYGNMEELREAKADYIVRSVAELKSFLLRGKQDPPKGLNMRSVRQVVLPFLMFMVVRSFVVILAMQLALMSGGRIAGIEVLTYDDSGEWTGFTGNASAVVQILGFLAGAAVIIKSARARIEQAAEDDRLLHLKAEPAKNYVFLGIAVLGAMFGLNLLLELTGILESSTQYQAVQAGQQMVSFLPGLVLYALVSPLAEELLFRGIIYNCLKRCMGAMAAMLTAALLFGAYHGNSVQMIYGFLMGCLFIYGYEYFGDFKVPVAMHSFVNMLTFCLGCLTEPLTKLVCWPVCIVSLAAAVTGLVFLGRQKKVLV